MGKSNWSRRRARLPRMVSVVLRALVVEFVFVQLRNGAVLASASDAVDDIMSIALPELYMEDRRYSHVFLSGRQIVFMQLPDDSDIRNGVDRYMSRRIESK